MMKKILAFLGLTDAVPEPILPQFGAPIDKDALKAMRGGVVAIANRTNGRISLAIRSADRGISGFVTQNGAFIPDADSDYESYGKPRGWQAYEVAPFEPFQIMRKDEEDDQRKGLSSRQTLPAEARR